MRENENDREGHTPDYVSPWAPRPGAPRRPEADDDLPPYYASDYPAAPDYPTAPDHPTVPNRHQDDTIAFGNPYQAWQPDGPYPPPPPPRRSRGGRAIIYLVVAVIAASVGAAATVTMNHGKNAASAAGSSAAQHGIPAQHNNASGSGASAGLNLRSVERKVKPGLVDIVSTLSYNNETAEGTGMILSSNGLVLTNNHVINQSTSITAMRVDGGQSYPAKVLGYDSSADVALLQLEGAEGLPTVSFGNSSQLSVGTPVLALGNAEGKGGATPAEGIINALNRSINASDEGSGGTENLHGMLQTSAQIQQGDSGGALANNAGQVVGMITAANTSSSQPGGTVGFAIPINSARSIALQIANGSPSSTVYIGTPGFLGIILPQSSSTNPQQQARDEQGYLEQSGQGPGGDGGSCIQNDAQLGAPSTVAPAQAGVVIIGVFCGTAVNAAGLVPGDVITSVNGARVATANGLRAATAKYHPGHALRLGWTDRDGAKHFADVTLGSGPVR